MDDHHFTLGLNSNMELLDNNITPLPGNDFADAYHLRHDRSLPFLSLLDGTDEEPSFNFGGDHQADSFYDPLTRFPPTTEDMIKRISGDESLGNPNTIPPKLRSRVTGENKTNRIHVCFYFLNYYTSE